MTVLPQLSVWTQRPPALAVSQSADIPSQFLTFPLLTVHQTASLRAVTCFLSWVLMGERHIFI